MPTHGPISGEPTCPRCGYDQSGEVATWTDRCPLGGRCPECGTPFRWPDLFDPARQEIGWLVEHAASLRQRARRTIPTLARMALPWVFWARVGVHAATRPRSIVLWLVLLFAALHGAAWLPFSILFAALDGGYALTTRDLSQVLRSGPLLRAGLVTGLVWPLAAVSTSGNWIWGGGYYNGWGLVSVWRFPLGLNLTWLAVLSCLPVTRRMAKLRPAHLARAVLFGLVGVVVGFEVLRVLVIVAFHANAGSITRDSVPVAYIAACVWTLVWWACAIRIGWGIRSWALIVLGTIAACLGGIVLSTIEMSVTYLLWQL